MAIKLLETPNFLGLPKIHKKITQKGPIFLKDFFFSISGLYSVEIGKVLWLLALPPKTPHY